MTAGSVEDARLKQFFDVRSELVHKGHIVGDLNPVFNRLRSEAPVHAGALRSLVGIDERDHHWTVERKRFTCFSFATCNTAFRDNETYSSELYLENCGIQRVGRTLLQMIGEEHKRYRAVLQPSFLLPKTRTWWRDNWIVEIVNSLTDQLVGQTSADLNIQLCARLPMDTVTRAFGMSGGDALTFRANLVTAIEATHVTEEERGTAFAKVFEMLSETVRRRRAAPGDDVISEIMARDLVLEDGSSRKLTDEEVIAHARLILLAGGGTTWRQLGITLVALLSNPEQLAAVRADRRLVDAAIEESLRWNPTDPVFSRLVTRDIEFGGVQIPAGAALDICLGAANRDPEVWEQPDKYDLHRKTHQHLGFSIGSHLCLGRDVARAEMSVAINALLDRFPKLRLDPDQPAPELLGGLEQRGMSAVPVLLQ